MLLERRYISLYQPCFFSLKSCQCACNSHVKSFFWSFDVCHDTTSYVNILDTNSKPKTVFNEMYKQNVVFIFTVNREDCISELISAIDDVNQCIGFLLFRCSINVSVRKSMIETIIQSVDVILSAGNAKAIVCNSGIIIFKWNVDIRTVLSQYTMTIDGSIIIKVAQK